MVRSAPLDQPPRSGGRSPEAGGTPSVRILERALDLLGCFTFERPTWSVSALAREMRMQKAVAHRLALTLERAGWLERDATDPSQYRVGARAFEVGSQYATTLPLTERALHIMRRLTAQTGLTTRLSVLHNGQALVIASVESDRALHVRGGVGARYPLHASAAGKVLVAFSGDAAASIVEEGPTLPGFTPRTIRTSSGLERELEEVRRQGYGTNVEEFGKGVSAIAAPVLGPDGYTAAALSFAYPSPQVAPEDFPGVIESLREAAAYLSRSTSAVLRLQQTPLT